MAQHQKPQKEVVRDWLKHEVKAHRPPPSPEEIRRQLGWELCEAERKNESRPDDD